MMRFASAVMGACVAGALLGCNGGGGDVGPGVRIVLVADLSGLPSGGDADEVMQDVRDVLKRRIEAWEVEDFSIEAEGSNRLSVRLTGVSAAEAPNVIGKTAQLEFRAPVLDDSRNIVCENADSSTYVVGFQPGAFTEDKTNNVMTCPPREDKKSGVVQWEPATGTDSQGVRRALTGSYLLPNAYVTDAPTAVAIEFTSEGGLVFEQITGELVGLPLAIFLDEQLVSAPTVQQPIAGGEARMSGLTSEEAKSLAIQLNSGALPVPVEVVSVEQKP